MKFYRKELEAVPLWIFGQPFRFDFLATEDVQLIHELDKCIAKQRGGVIAITQQEYELEAQKKTNEQSLRNASQPHQQRQELKAFQPLEDRRVVGVVANPGGRRNGMFARPQTDRDGIGAHRPNQSNEPMPDPIQIPSPSQFITPPTAKLSEMKK